MESGFLLLCQMAMARDGGISGHVRRPLPELQNLFFQVLTRLLGLQSLNLPRVLSPCMVVQLVDIQEYAAMVTRIRTRYGAAQWRFAFPLCAQSIHELGLHDVSWGVQIRHGRAKSGVSTCSLLVQVSVLQSGRPLRRKFWNLIGPMLIGWVGFDIWQKTPRT
tara:strand:- start:10241 stop:10729 length:489 start_codon:yes stop_codon:yes gene_type:complete